MDHEAARTGAQPFAEAGETQLLCVEQPNLGGLSEEGEQRQQR